MNRLLLALSLILGAVPMAHAQYECSAATPFNEESLGAEIERVQGEYKADEAAHQERISRHAKVLVDAGAWTPDEKSAFFTGLLKDPEFLRYEQEKKSLLDNYLSELQLAFTVGQANPAGACGHASNTVNRMKEIAEASQAQYKLMEARLQQAATAEGVTLPATP